MNLSHVILVSLEDVLPFLLPEKSLLDVVNLQLPRPATLSELKTELSKLEADRRVVSVRDKITDAIKWKITDEGRAILAERR